MYFCTLEGCESLGRLLYAAVKYGPLTQRILDCGSRYGNLHMIKLYRNKHTYKSEIKFGNINNVDEFYQCQYQNPGCDTVLQFAKYYLQGKMSKVYRFLLFLICCL